MDLENIDLKEIKNLDNFSGIAPVFPLSTVVFFPNTLLPLHIFEPRYRDMLTDSLNSEKIIAMALLKPGWENDYYGSPEIFDIAGMGRIVSSETFNDGRSNIVLYGLKRIRIVETLDFTPYRKARIEILENGKSSNEQVYKQKISNLVSGWNNMIGSEHEKHKININCGLPLDNLTDVLASVLLTNIFDKQSLLEETEIDKRAESLIRTLETRIKFASITSGRSYSIMKTRNLN